MLQRKTYINVLPVPTQHLFRRSWKVEPHSNVLVRAVKKKVILIADYNNSLNACFSKSVWHQLEVCVQHRLHIYTLGKQHNATGDKKPMRPLTYDLMIQDKTGCRDFVLGEKPVGSSQDSAGSARHVCVSVFYTVVNRLQGQVRQQALSLQLFFFICVFLQQS